MLRYLILPVFILVSVTASAQYVKTRLWKISGNGLAKPSYIYGSMHVYDNSAFNFSDSVFAKLKECEIFANEVAADSIVKYMYQSVESGYEKKMQSIYFEDDDALDQISRNTGIEKTAIKKFSPVLLKQLLNDGFSPDNEHQVVVDYYLYSIAKREGKSCIGVENMNSQLNLYDRLPEYSKKNFSEYTIGKNRITNNINLIKIYHNADLNSAEEFLKALPDEVYSTVFSQRNYNMVKSIDSISRINSAFYTIGFGHLPGNEGLINLLRIKGYKVDPIPETFTGIANKFKYNNSEIAWKIYEDKKSGYQVEFPGQHYTSPLIQSNITHAQYYDLGTNCYYITIARTVPSSQLLNNSDSLYKQFVNTAWKIDTSNLKVTHGEENGLRFVESNRMKLGGFFLSFRMYIYENNLFLMMGMNYGEKETDDISRFLNSVKVIEKVPDNWLTYKSKQGGFEVNFPGIPNEKNVNQSAESDAFKVVVFTGFDNTTGSEFLVQYMKKPGQYFQADTSLMSLIIKGLLEEHDYIQITESDTNFEGYPAKNLKLQNNTGTNLQIMIVERGSRLYNLVSSYQNKPECISQAEYFHNSFRFTDYNWENWKDITSNEGNFKTIAPAIFSKTSDNYFDDKYILSDSYLSTDEATDEFVKVTHKRFSPYYRAKCDSLFFVELYKENSSNNDSLIEFKKVNNTPITWEYKASALHSGSTSSGVYLLNGRNLYNSECHIDNASQSKHPGIKSVNEFRINEPISNEDLNTNNTTLLLSHLASNDSTLYKNARKALDFYQFNSDELPGVWETLSHPLIDDSENWGSSRAKLFSTLEPLDDSILCNYIISHYNEICLNNESKVSALHFLTRNKNAKYTNFVKQSILSIPQNQVAIFDQLFDYSDTSAFLVGMYPEIMHLITDTLSYEYLIYRTTDLLDKQLINAQSIVNNKQQVLDLLKNIVQNRKSADECSYYKTHLAYLAGFYKDKSINKILSENQKTNNKYIQLNIVKSLIYNDINIKSTVIKQLAADPETRRELYAFLHKKEQDKLMPSCYKTQQSLAESDLYNYLLYEEDAPDHIQLIGTKNINYTEKTYTYYLFSVRNSEENIYYEIAGGYLPDGTLDDAPENHFGLYWSSDPKLTPEEHFSAFEKILNNETPQN